MSSLQRTARPKVDSGPNMRKFLENHDENRLNCRFKRTSKCTKISSRRLAGLLTSEMDSLHLDSPRSMCSVYSESENPWVGPPNADLLLLDVRIVEDFETSHIAGAFSYPASYIKRSTNQFTPEIYKIKNRPNSVIVLYDLDDLNQVAEDTAVEFLDKGVENVAVLKGGLLSFAHKYPTLMSADVPVQWVNAANLARTLPKGSVPPKAPTPRSTEQRKLSGKDTYQRRNITEIRQTEQQIKEQKEKREVEERDANERKARERQLRMADVKSKFRDLTVASSSRVESVVKESARTSEKGSTFKHGKPSATQDPLKNRTTPRGQIPEYLVKRKHDAEVQEQEQIREEVENSGMRLVSDAEKISTLNQLFQNKHLTEKYLGDLELKATPANEPQRRELMEKLKLIDEAIILFSKDTVYIQDQ
ncbi:hypothetical protein RCL1_004642 [Eukaryota sp. TZLM3-RCL]